MTFKRLHYNSLLKWKGESTRKPLLIRGARQVGKSTLVRQFSSEFDHYLEVNLEKKEDASFFTHTKLSDTVNSLLLSRNIRRKENETLLLFIDEIQEIPDVIQQLRYFFEDYPEMHVIAAGSLLEFALGKVKSFPVGRVHQELLHPFNFEEYLMARGELNLLEELKTIPVNEYAHDLLLEKFNEFTIIGGMPEVIRSFIENNSFEYLPKIYDDIWQAYKDDIPKYAKSRSEQHILNHVISSAHLEKDRITMAGFGQSNYKSREIGEALRTIDKSRIIQLIYPATSYGLPIQPDLKRKPRLQFLDTGLLNHISGNQANLIGLKDLHEFHRGRIVAHIVYQEIISRNTLPGIKPMFWVREKANSNAEVDLVTQHNNLVIPIEIKAGPTGRLRSLHHYMENCDHQFAVRVSSNKLKIENITSPNGAKYQLLNMPYYLSGLIPDYLNKYLINP